MTAATASIFILRHDPTASAAFAETHVRRLEAMRRLGGHVERERTEAGRLRQTISNGPQCSSGGQARLSPVTVETLSIGAVAATDWHGRRDLARPRTGRGEAGCRPDLGFGREVRDALARRRQWLIEQGFAREEQERTLYRATCWPNCRTANSNALPVSFLESWVLPIPRPNPGHGSRASIAVTLIWRAGVSRSSRKAASLRLSLGGRCWNAISENPCQGSCAAMRSHGRSDASAEDQHDVCLRADCSCTVNSLQILHRRPLRVRLELQRAQA